MKPLTANLKHLYQYRFMWIFHLILAMAISSLFRGMISVGPPDSPYLVSWIIFTLYGEMISLSMTGISNKPFAFCLPDHVREVKKMLLTIWLFITIVCFLILSILYVLNIHIDPSLFVCSMGLISLCFWLGASIFIGKLGASLCIILFLAYFSPILLKHMGITINIQLIIVDHPFIITISSGMLCYSIYTAIGSRTNHRRLCGTPWAGFAGVKIQKQHRIKQEWMYRNKKISFDKTTELFGTYFAKCIRSNRHSRLIPYLWGQVYLIITPIFIQWKLLWIPFLGAYIFFVAFPCIYPQLKGSGLYLFNMIMLIMCSLIFSIMCTYARFKNFLLSGRRVLFCQGIVVLLTTIILAIGFLVASNLLFHLLSMIFPKIMLMGKSSMTTVPWSLLAVVPFIMVPLFGGLSVLFRGIILMIALSVTVFFAIIISFCAGIAMENIPFIMNPVIVLFAAAITWVFHIAALYYTSMKRSLC